MSQKLASAAKNVVDNYFYRITSSVKFRGRNVGIEDFNKNAEFPKIFLFPLTEKFFLSACSKIQEVNF